MSVTLAAQQASDFSVARDAIRARVEAAGTSFYWAMRLLPEARRDAMFAIYAFCREVDDIADSNEPPESKRRDLAAWRCEVDAIMAGHPATVTGQALTGAVRQFGLRQEDFLAVIDGMEMDAAADIRAPSLADLDLYCDRVAGAVGRLSVRAFGIATPAADRVARSLGRALQLTNILRDLAEDSARGRLYLPRELLDRNGIASSDPAFVLAHPSLPLICDELAITAEGYFAEARAAMAECPRKNMRPAAAMGAVYHAILVRLKRRGWRDLEREVHISKAAKLWLAVRYGLL